MALPWTIAVLSLAGAMAAACDEQTDGAPEPVAPPPAGASARASEAAEAPFFVGRWAAREELCDDGAWVFTERGVSTAGEVSCTFDSAQRVPAGFEIAATCTAEGPPAPYDIRLRYAESAQALLVEGGPFADIGLIACPKRK
jgi:hypothetical protein